MSPRVRRSSAPAAGTTPSYRPEPTPAAVGERGQRPAHVGRARELRVWQEAVRAAREGSGGVVVVTGEAGIGKSRLVEECLVTGQGSVTATVGACPPVAGADLPYAPILQGLRELGRGLPPLERNRMVAGWPPELATLVLPSVIEVTPDDAPAGRGGAALPELPVSPTAQVRFFEGLLRVLVQLARQRPVAFVVEDLHWADRSTLDLLVYLASNVRAEAVVLLLTSRDELERGHPLRRWLAEVCRLPHTRRLELNRLTREETAQLLAGLLRDIPDSDLVDAVFARAEGNPLFTEMLLAETRAGTSELPPMLGDLLGARFAELSDSGQRLLRVASAAGRRVQHELLAEVADLGPDDLDRGLRQLVDRRLLDPAADGEAFDFHHELFREVAYADLLPGQRRRVHRALAEALTKRPDLAAGGTEASAGETAHHYLAAGDWARALPVAVEAGLAAERAFAFADVLRHLRAAAQAWDRVPEAARLSPLSRPALLARAAQAADLVGDQGLALDLVEQALAAVDGADSRAVALLYERRGTFHYNAGHADAAHADFTGALALLPAEPPSTERARVLASLALLNMAWTRLDDASRAALESIRLARAVGARREEGRARNALGVVTAYAGDFDSGVAHLTAALRLAQEVADPDDIAAAAIDLGHVLGVAGRYEEAVRACLDGYETTRRLGLEGEHGSFLLANAAECLIKSGRWGKAEQLLADALHRAPRGLRAFPVLMQSAWLALRRGRYDAAAERLAGARALLDDSGGGPSGWRRELMEGEAELAVGQGRTRDAIGCVDRGLTLAEEADEQRFAGPLIATGMRAAADEAERGRARREPAVVTAADADADALWTRASRLRPCPVGDEVVILPEATALAATCAGERGRRTDRPDARAWERAAAAWETLGRPYEAAYAQWRGAEALFAGGRVDAATTALRAARAVAAELGAEALLTEITALAGWRRVALEVFEPAPATAADNTLGLTARELEVLARVTAGQTNRQIAEGLFISVKTASVHVSNILRKLEVGSREDAARIGRQLGLSPRPGHPSRAQKT